MSSSGARPNVLFLCVDQQRHDWLGYRGATWVRTPNLDALARRGVVFTNCCSTAPTCAPARISLATGLHAMRFSAWGNHAYLPLSRPTYYQRLRDHGYHVAAVGKFDLAKPDPYNGIRGDRPLNYAWGFTHPLECEGKMHAGRLGPDGQPQGPYGHYLRERGLHQAFIEDCSRRRALGQLERAAWDSVLPADDFEDAFIGRRAAEWLRDTPGDFPWHLFVSFVGPHNPFDPPTKYADHFRNAPMPDPVQAVSAGKTRRYAERARTGLPPEDVRVARRQYAAAIEAIDDQVGEIMAVLDRRGWRDNTYIVFSSDHGEMLGDHGLWTKYCHYEAALRVPLFVSGPGIVPGECDVPVEWHDINPTICDLTGVGALERLDAHSLVPVLRDAAVGHREHCFAALPHEACIRTRGHKLIHGTDGHMELYDLKADPDEQVNLAEQEPRLVSELTMRMHRCHLEGGCLR